MRIPIDGRPGREGDNGPWQWFSRALLVAQAAYLAYRVMRDAVRDSLHNLPF